MYSLFRFFLFSKLVEQFFVIYDFYILKIIFFGKLIPFLYEYKHMFCLNSSFQLTLRMLETVSFKSTASPFRLWFNCFASLQCSRNSRMFRFIWSRIGTLGARLFAISNCWAKHTESNAEIHAAYVITGFSVDKSRNYTELYKM